MRRAEAVHRADAEPVACATRLPFAPASSSVCGDAARERLLLSHMAHFAASPRFSKVHREHAHWPGVAGASPSKTSMTAFLFSRSACASAKRQASSSMSSPLPLVSARAAAAVAAGRGILPEYRETDTPRATAKLIEIARW